MNGGPVNSSSLQLIANEVNLILIATDVDLIPDFVFAIPRSSAHPSIGAKLLWDTDGDGRVDGGAMLIDHNRDGDFGDPREIRVFGKP